MSNPYSLKGKTILVTGASSGIGRSIAIECSNLEANVVLTARSEDRLEETRAMMHRGSHSVIISELTDKTSLQNLVSKLPELDGVVLCAGKGMTLPITFSTQDKFEEIFAINFFAPVELLRLIVKKKKLNKKSASVVAISSIGGPELVSIGNGVYGASKSALYTIMRFFALELAPKHVRVNCICPGMVETPLIHQDNLTQEQLDTNAKIYPLQRLGRPEDVAYATAFLLSDASTWITGTSIVVDGGITLIN